MNGNGRPQPSIYTPTAFEPDVTDAIHAAFENLTAEEKEKILAIGLDLRHKLDQRSKERCGRGCYIGEKGILELLAKLVIFCNGLDMELFKALSGQ